MICQTKSAKLLEIAKLDCFRNEKDLDIMFESIAKTVQKCVHFSYFKINIYMTLLQLKVE